MDSAFEYVKAEGIETEQAYPYEAVERTCRYNKAIAYVKNTGHRDIAKDDNDALMASIAQQPISVAVDAPPFQLYSSGIFSNWNCGTSLDHGVLAVGYGAENGALYYKIKNSWGTSWGEKGYIRFARRTGKGVGMCGVTRMASYPLFGPNSD
jgi:KDEL-tailed cysteine endopeptidase